MYGKTGGPENAVGMMGLGEDPDTRARVDVGLEWLGIGLSSQDLAHVGVARFLSARLYEHLREHYPVPRRAMFSIDESVKAEGEDAGDTVIDTLSEDATRRVAEGRAGEPSVIAYEKDGVKYLYADEMAMLCGVTADQLRLWDRERLVPAQRLAHIWPKCPHKHHGKWRVYPATSEAIGRVRMIKLLKKERRTGLAEGEYRRPSAARVLGRSADTLKDWEEKGIAQPERREGMPIYTREEIKRIAEEKNLTPRW